MKTSIIFFNNDCFYFMQYFRLQSTLLTIRVVSFLTHAVGLRSPLNINATGISSPIPAPRLTLFAVTLTHIRVPGNLRNCRNTRATFAGTCPTTLSSTRLSWITATASCQQHCPFHVCRKVTRHQQLDSKSLHTHGTHGHTSSKPAYQYSPPVEWPSKFRRQKVSDPFCKFVTFNCHKLQFQLTMYCMWNVFECIRMYSNLLYK